MLFLPNTRSHDHDTHIKHNIHYPIEKYVIIQSNTHSLQGFSGCIKT